MIRTTRRPIVMGLAALALAMFLFVSSAGQALAFHCYVANKPNGAGAVKFEDIKQAGNSGRLVAPGAFLSASELPPWFPIEADVFIRGQPIPPESQEPESQEEDDPDPVGLGSLPEPPHVRGSSTNGVQSAFGNQ